MSLFSQFSPAEEHNDATIPKGFGRVRRRREKMSAFFRQLKFVGANHNDEAVPVALAAAVTMRTMIHSGPVELERHSRYFVSAVWVCSGHVGEKYVVYDLTYRRDGVFWSRRSEPAVARPSKQPTTHAYVFAAAGRIWAYSAL